MDGLQSSLSKAVQLTFADDEDEEPKYKLADKFKVHYTMFGKGKTPPCLSQDAELQEVLNENVFCKNPKTSFKFMIPTGENISCEL